MNKSSIKTRLQWILLVIIVLIIDLSSKFFVLKYLSPGERVPLFPSLNLYCVFNKGAAFGLFSSNRDCYPWFLIITSICVCTTLSLIMYNTESSQNYRNIAYALINGGALGNLCERLWHGFVVDMIDFYVFDWHFATFNLADSSIFIGILLLILKDFLQNSSNDE